MATLSNSTRLELADEIDATLDAVTKGIPPIPNDPFSVRQLEIDLASATLDAWDAAIEKARGAIDEIGRGVFFTHKPTPDQVVAAIGHSVSQFSKHLPDVVDRTIETAFMRGRLHANQMFRSQTGKEPIGRTVAGKSGELQSAGFGLIFGLTEDHALQALADQYLVSAGGFWDEQMSDSIKAEVEGYYNGTTTRQEMIDHLQRMINTRLVSDGAKALPGSYFENLAVHQVMRSRNVGSLYRATSLGATTYTLVNPRDNRTSSICLQVTNGQRYTVAAAGKTAGDIIGARNMGELRDAQPFYKTGDSVADGPVPPLHWPRCRTRMNYIFE